MMNAHVFVRFGILAAGLAVGAAVAATPGIASADGLDFQISIDGYDLLPTTDNSASASSGIGDIAIAYGDGASANASDGSGNFAAAFGNNVGALAGGSSASDFDTAIVTGSGSSADAVYGNGDTALVDATDSTAYTGGSDTGGVITTSGNDLSAVIDPFGTGHDFANAGYNEFGGPGGYDLGAILFEDNTTTANSTGADYLYDILSPSGNEIGTAAATSGGWLAELLSLF
jgi:hypothetical protein